MFSKILIANRGEIAVRIIRTCRRLGIATVQVFSDADADSLAVEMADEAIHIGPAPAIDSYLAADRILAAARASGAEAVHPGFGFLAENAAFARMLEEAGVVFIGPNAAAIEAMGDKVASKRVAAAAGVPTVPGHAGVIETPDQAVRFAGDIGYPVMIKASAGGGGKGIRIAHDEAGLVEGLASVRAEARSTFGDDRVFLEKFIANPRHIEIQVLGDRHGNLVHLFERECSIQRRNQKVIEEAPSPLLDDETRMAMGAQAVALARAVGYDSAGTVEFVVGQDRSFFFLEMNTRIQVEHPVTELITGVDLVEQMIRSAAGEPLSVSQEDLKIDGWAIESRIYAEDPYRDFLPSIGRLSRYRSPDEGERAEGFVRVDSGVREGDEISIFYDPMVAKVCAWGPDRPAAIAAMSSALEEVHLEGVEHNTPFLSAVLDEARFRSGRIATGYIGETFPKGFHGLEPTDFQTGLMIASAVMMHAFGRARTGAPERLDWTVVVGAVAHPVRLDLTGEGLTIHRADGPALMLSEADWRPGQPQISAVLDGQAFTADVARRPDGWDIRHRAATERVRVLTREAAAFLARLPERREIAGGRAIVSPMPGLVVSIEVSPGEQVRAGQAVAVIEAMKMQNIIRAERDATVKAVGARPGDSVAADEVLVEFA